MGDNEPMDDEETSREAEAWRQLEADIRRKNEEFELRRQELLRQQQQRKTVSLYKRGCAYRSIHVYMYTYLSIYLPTYLPTSLPNYLSVSCKIHKNRIDVGRI